MKTYWDLSERERSQLDGEEIDRYLEIERMERGAIRPEAPVFETLVETKELITRTMYVVQLDSYTKGDVAYETSEDAHAVIRTKSMRIRHDYGSTIDYVTPVELAVEPVQVVDQETFNKERVARETFKTAKEHNEKKQNAYETEMNTYHEIDTDLRENWFECQRTNAEHAKVTRTFEEYIVTAEGDKVTAANFLNKAFTDMEIRAAFEWFGRPNPFTVDMPAEESAS